MSHERALSLYWYLANTDWQDDDTEKALIVLLLSERRYFYESAIDHLRHEVFNDEFPFPHTAPAALVIIGMLFDPDLVDSLAPVRTRLLGLLQTFMQADLFAPRLRTSNLPGTRVEETEPWTLVIPQLVPLVDQELEHADAKVRLRAVSLAGHLYQSPRTKREDRLRVYNKISELAQTAPTPRFRANYIYALGHIDRLPAELLTDPAPEIRLCAALSPFDKDNPEAHRVIIQILEDHADQLNQWFPHGLDGPTFYGPFSWMVVFTLLERVRDFELLKKAAIRLISIETFLDQEWAPFLPVAFAASPGQITTQAQFEFLSAVVASNRKVWNKIGLSNSHAWLKKAGLPKRPEELARLVEEARADLAYQRSG